MALNIAQLVTGAFGIAQSLVPTALPAVTIRANPTTTVNPVTDTEVTVWGVSLSGIKTVAYADQNERDSEPAETNQRSFAVNAADLAPHSPAIFTQTTEIQTPDGLVWQVYRVNPDPTGSLLIFYARR